MKSDKVSKVFLSEKECSSSDSLSYDSSSEDSDNRYSKRDRISKVVLSSLNC